MSIPDQKTAHIDKRTCRPDSAYPRKQTNAERYAEEFSRALGLKPTRTTFGTRVVEV